MRRVVWLSGLLALLCSSGRAQDMRFSLDETNAAAAHAAPGLPEAPAGASTVLARALDHYDAERFAQAAVLLQNVIEGATDDGPGAVQQAEFFLAKTLLHLGFEHAALAVIDQITGSGHAHPYFAHTLPWLARIAQRHPRSSAVHEVIGRFAPGDIEQMSSVLDVEGRALLWLLLGEHAYREGALERAIEHFARVDRRSSHALRARVFEGLAHVRRRRAKPAIRAFRAIVQAVDSGETHGATEPERLRNLAWLALGRLYYTAAMSNGDRQREGALLGNAVHAFSQVDTSSEYWLDALFESGWALFVSDEQARALGNLHALLSPFFPGALYPEADLLRAVIFFSACQMDNASAALAAFHDRYDRHREELRAVLERDPEGAELLGLAARSVPGATEAAKGPPISPALEQVLRRVLSDREVQHAVVEIAALAREREALERAPRTLRDASVGGRIRQDLLVAHSFAEAHGRDLARARAERLLEELQQAANQADTIEIELLNYERHRLGAPPRPAHAEGRSVHVDSEHQLWPFNGEYWRDELGYYRQEVSDRCDPR